MRSIAVLVLLSLWGCDAEVVVPDGDGPEGGGGTTNPPSGGATSTDGGAGTTPSTFDAVAACSDTCSRPCVGDPAICQEDCLATIAPNCERESFESYECAMWYCDPSCDADALESKLHACINPFLCGHGGNDLECDPDQEPGDCDCVGQCDENHVGRIVCNKTGSCDCYFDGELVASCAEELIETCGFQIGCCAPYMLPGGGPAASNE